MLDRSLNSSLDGPPFGRDDQLAAGWAVSPGLVAYPAAVAAMATFYQEPESEDTIHKTVIRLLAIRYALNQSEP